MGGVIPFNHAYIKGWSRKIQTTCLSSRESELHAIAEGCTEAMAFSILAESLLHGLPSKDSYGIYIRTHSTLKMALWTDHERLSVHYIPGSQNGADFLTKCSDRDHIQHLLWTIGSEESDYDHRVSLAVIETLGHLHLSSQNRRRVQEGIEVTVRKILDEACQMVPFNDSKVTKVKKVSFGEVEIQECESVRALRAIPRKWDSFLKRHVWLKVFENPFLSTAKGICWCLKCVVIRIPV